MTPDLRTRAEQLKREYDTLKPEYCALLAFAAIQHCDRILAVLAAAEQREQALREQLDVKGGDDPDGRLYVRPEQRILPNTPTAVMEGAGVTQPSVPPPTEAERHAFEAGCEAGRARAVWEGSPSLAHALPEPPATIDAAFRAYQAREDQG